MRTRQWNGPPEVPLFQFVIISSGSPKQNPTFLEKEISISRCQGRGCHDTRLLFQNRVNSRVFVSPRPPWALFRDVAVFNFEHSRERGACVAWPAHVLVSTTPLNAKHPRTADKEPIRLSSTECTVILVYFTFEGAFRHVGTLLNTRKLCPRRFFLAQSLGDALR